MSLPRLTSMAAVLAAIVLATACATVTEIGIEDLGVTQQADAAASVSRGSRPSADAMTGDLDETDTPDTLAAVADELVPDGWQTMRSATYRMAVPSDWAVVTRAADVDEAIDGLSGQRFSELEKFLYEGFLAYGDSVIALSDEGDLVSAFKYFGDADQLTDLKGVTRELELELLEYGTDVELESVGARLDAVVGVFTEGSYRFEGDTYYTYQLRTYKSLHNYFVAVTLRGRADKRLAAQILNTFTFDRNS